MGWSFFKIICVRKKQQHYTLISGIQIKTTKCHDFMEKKTKHVQSMFKSICPELNDIKKRLNILGSGNAWFALFFGVL